MKRVESGRERASSRRAAQNQLLEKQFVLRTPWSKTHPDAADFFTGRKAPHLFYCATIYSKEFGIEAASRNLIGGRISRRGVVRADFEYEVREKGVDTLAGDDHPLGQY
ncbi:hypothetical protein CCAX7_36650 [Capsulimonas corticalis]|uniref:Uncharacterized protein n=1 Tax=Capsulimonas corticalis TaxID=2219043 RepID=A0A402D1F4_9BACT|nr:hypothetical protein CCAX7_36650 [Capsulimonas corticalis]